MCSTELHRQCSERRQALLEARTKLSLHCSRLLHSSDPWKVCLHEAWRFGICTVYACIRNAGNGKGDICFHHSPKCSAGGCSSIAILRGLCKKHDGKKICSTEGCDTAVLARGVCQKHGAYGLCSYFSCPTAVAARGRCSKHSGGNTKVCKIKGCTTLA